MSDVNKLTKEERISKINNAEKILRIAENERVASVTREEQFTKEIKKCEDELAKLGTTPETAETKIKELEEEMDRLLKEIEDNLPVELLKSLGKL
jgi:ATP-dependent exoDNAse (exonuclease V) alpha subunit